MALIHSGHRGERRNRTAGPSEGGPPPFRTVRRFCTSFLELWGSISNGSDVALAVGRTGTTLRVMRAYALVTAVSPQKAVDVYLRAEEAEKALEAALRDEPHWGAGLLRVEEIELDERDVSAN